MVMRVHLLLLYPLWLVATFYLISSVIFSCFSSSLSSDELLSESSEKMSQKSHPSSSFSCSFSFLEPPHSLISFLDFSRFQAM